MNEIERMRTRLDGAGSVSATLDQAWDAFDMIRAISRRHEQRAGADFAAYAMAAASAVRGRNLLTTAPSITPSNTAAPDSTPSEPAYSGEPADALASLASLLSSRLLSAALSAPDAIDRKACVQAAAEADSICTLLRGE